MEQQTVSINKFHYCKIIYVWKQAYSNKLSLSVRSKIRSGNFSVIIISCSCHDCTTILSRYWDSKPKKNLISQDMLGYIIASNLKLLLVKMTGLY